VDGPGRVKTGRRSGELGGWKLELLGGWELSWEGGSSPESLEGGSPGARGWKPESSEGGSLEARELGSPMLRRVAQEGS
jgi:hypothetical protein